VGNAFHYAVEQFFTSTIENHENKNALSRDRVTVDPLWIGNWMY
jgi:hypothetical protein